MIDPKHLRKMAACAPFADNEAGLPEMATALRDAADALDAARPLIEWLSIDGNGAPAERCRQARAWLASTPAAPAAPLASAATAPLPSYVTQDQAVALVGLIAEAIDDGPAFHREQFLADCCTALGMGG